MERPRFAKPQTDEISEAGSQHAQASRPEAPSTLLEMTWRFLGTDDAAPPYPHTDGL